MEQKIALSAQERVYLDELTKQIYALECQRVGAILQTGRMKGFANATLDYSEGALIVTTKEASK